MGKEDSDKEATGLESTHPPGIMEVEFKKSHLNPNTGEFQAAMLGLSVAELTPVPVVKGLAGLARHTSSQAAIFHTTK